MSIFAATYSSMLFMYQNILVLTFLRFSSKWLFCIALAIFRCCASTLFLNIIYCPKVNLWSADDKWINKKCDRSAAHHSLKDCMRHSLIFIIISHTNIISIRISGRQLLEKPYDQCFQFFTMSFVWEIE
jgi:hypothetical protein